jgi:hypothetical protein
MAAPPGVGIIGHNPATGKPVEVRPRASTAVGPPFDHDPTTI